MISYLLFGITFLFYLGLISINTSEPSMAGEGGMGYGLALFALGIGFALTSLLLTISIARQDGFLWVAEQSGIRTVLLGLGWLFMAATTLACAAFKWEWHEGEFPQYLRWLAVSNGYVWIPLLMFIPYFILLNTGIKASVPLNSYKIPLQVGFIISALCSAGLLFGWLKISVESQAAEIQSMQNQDRKIHDDHLASIAQHQPTDPLVNILALSGRFHDEDIRQAAIAKIKEHPAYEKELIGLLDNEYYFTEVYTYIDGNKVEHSDLFLEPLNRSIYRLADKIEKEITDSYNLQDWHFESYGIERMLRAIDEQFLNQGTDFRPAVLKLQEALVTKPPEGSKKIHFTVTPVVDQWLRKHKPALP